MAGSVDAAIDILLGGPPLAHPGHWLVDALYVAPVAAFLIWLGINEWRARRSRKEEGGDQPLS